MLHLAIAISAWDAAGRFRVTVPDVESNRKSDTCFPSSDSALGWVVNPKKTIFI